MLKIALFTLIDCMDIKQVVDNIPVIDCSILQVCRKKNKM